MRLIDLLNEVLDSGGIRCCKQSGHIQLTLCSGPHKWSVCFTEDRESFLKYYARYPWHIAPDRLNETIAALNEMNVSLRAGCFLVSEGYVVFRYGVYIFDEFTAKEIIADLFITAAAKTEAAWDEVYRAVCGREVH